MNNDNIFATANFGDKFITRDGRTAILIEKRDNYNELIVQGNDDENQAHFIFVTKNNGKYNAYWRKDKQNEDYKLDIISKFQ